jgi:hypothetical protein
MLSTKSGSVAAPRAELAFKEAHGIAAGGGGVDAARRGEQPQCSRPQKKASAIERQRQALQIHPESARSAMSRAKRSHPETSQLTKSPGLLRPERRASDSSLAVGISRDNEPVGSIPPSGGLLLRDKEDAPRQDRDRAILNFLGFQKRSERVLTDSRMTRPHFDGAKSLVSVPMQELF